MPKVARETLNPNNPGPNGRPSNAYREWLAAQAMKRKRLKAIETALQDDEHKHFATMNIHLDHMVLGKPLQQVQVEDTTPARALTGEAIALKLLEALPLLLQGHPTLAPRLTGQAAIDAEFSVEEG